LPYQPLNGLSKSLSAADLQVVVMGEKFVGIVHPCKVYNILTIGAPILYIGPEPSHVTDIASQHGRFFLARHGDVDAVVSAIQNANEFRQREPVSAFAKEKLLSSLIALVEVREDLQGFSGLQDSYPANLESPVHPVIHRQGGN
jgi:hypothetical protein